MKIRLRQIRGWLLLASAVLCFSCQTSEKEDKPGGFAENQSSFPFALPNEKPDIPMSAASHRMFEYNAPRVQDNELFSQFKYSRINGFDYAGGDGTISRRDPSRPIVVNGKYYIWYTKRHTIVSPIGAQRAQEATDEIPSTDWDLADIWYATSLDGVNWEEQGVAVYRPTKPASGWRSLATPDVLVWKDKYYLYYQAFSEPSGLKGDLCPVSVSYADDPAGPWQHGGDEVIPFGLEGDWDRNATHDPHPIVFKGRIYLYYKAAYNKWPDNRTNYAVGHGLAIADDPLGPFEKHPLNPVLHSSHETVYFPFKEGVATIVIRDGNERETIQFAGDGVNFEIQSGISLPPTAGAPYVADAFSNTKFGRGFTWGLCHFINAGTSTKRYSMIARFDCDLSLDVHEPALKGANVWHRPEVYFQQSPQSAGLDPAKRSAIR